MFFSLEGFPSLPTKIPSSSFKNGNQNTLNIQDKDHILSFPIITSPSLTGAIVGFALAPSPSDMYPVKPLSAPIPIPVDVAVGSGSVTSTTLIVGMENMA
jgi:hypothetical protein